MKRFLTWMLVLGFIVSTGFVTGCKKDEAPSPDDAMEEAADEAEQAADEVEETADDMAE